MEILKGFSFSLQRHADWYDTALTDKKYYTAEGVAQDTAEGAIAYYDGTNTTLLVLAGSTIEKVETLNNDGSATTIAVGTGFGTTPAKATSGTITLKHTTAANGTFTFEASANTNLIGLTKAAISTAPAGGTFTVTAGSVAVSAGVTASVKTGDATIAVTATGAPTISSAGLVTAGTAIGTFTGSGTYTVAADVTNNKITVSAATAPITLANGDTTVIVNSGVVDGTTTYVSAGGIRVNKIDTAAWTFSVDAQGAATATATGGSVDVKGIGTVGGVKLLTADSEATIANDGTVSELVAGSSITPVGNKSVATAASTAGSAFTIGGTKWVAGNTASFTVTDGNLAAGSVLVGGSGMAVADAKIGDNAIVKSYDGGSTNDGIVVTYGATIAACTFTDLDAGEVVEANNVTYTGVDANTVKMEGTGGTKYYVVSNGIATATFTETGNTGTGKPAAAAGGSVTEVNVGDINLNKYTDGTKVAFTSYGLQLSSADDTNAAVTVQYNTSSKSSTVSVSKALTVNVVTTGVDATITDSVGNNNVLLATGETIKLAKSGSLTVDSTGVVKAASATVISTGTVADLHTTVSNGSFELSGGAKGIIFDKGASVDGATVKLQTGDTITLTESGNNSSDATDTAVASDGTITGLDGDFTVGKAINTKNLTTTGSGTATINGKTWTVAGDDNGATFTVDTSLSGQVDTIANLAKDATVSTTSKLAGDNITVGTTNFGSLTAKNGVTFTQTAAATTATVALMTAKDSVVIGANTYTVDSMGSASDGIVVGANSLSALNDGDKITVTATGKSFTYEVTGNLLVVTDNNNADSTTSWTLSDPDDAGFTITNLLAVPVKGQVNGDLGTTAAVKFGNPNSTLVEATSLADGLYVDADGKTTSSSSKAVAKLSIADDVITYVSQSSKAQEVSVSGATNKNDWNITTGTGKDVVVFTTDTAATVDSGAGDDIITVGGTGDKAVNTGDGKNTVNLGGSGDITLTLGNGKDTVSYAAAGTGDLVINATGGNNTIDLSKKGTKGDVTITGGSGNDTITASSADNVVSGGDGKDVFKVGTGITISDYSFDNDVIFTGGAFNVTDEGKVSVSGGKADISANAGDFYTAQIVTAEGVKAENWAWAKDGGSNIDITTYTKNAHLKGDADGTNQLYAGSGDDNITSFADGDSVYGGAGKNYISLASGKEKRVVGVSVAAKGKDTISGFKASFEDEGDSFFLVDGNISDTTLTVDSVSGSSANLTMKNGSASVSLVGAGVSTVTGAVEIKAGSAKIAAINKGATATVSSASYADAYIGKDSAVNFSAVDGELNIDLSNNLTASGNGPKFVGVTSVVGGAGSNTIIGSAKGDYMVAGTGTTSLYGGAGADTLVGNGEADMFFFGNSSGTDTITSFQAAGVDSADTVKVLGDVTAAKLNGSAIELGTNDGSKAVITNLATGSINANTMVKIESNNFTGVAKIGSASSANNFTYDKAVGYYGGGSAADKVSVASSFSDDAEVWLDGSKGTAYASVDVVDFSNGAGNYVLAGDSSKNTIVGGKGSSSLWGGSGSSADSIKGGTGTNMFFWGTGEGNDTVASSNADDTVNLYTVKLADVDLTNTQITNSGVVLALNDGSKLTVQTSRDINFTVDGTSWTAVHNTKEWKQNS